jgi:N-methylhydantoinase A
MPGPICYGRGGTQPTISDANLLLGRLNAKKLLSVANAASVEAIGAIFEEKLGVRLGVDAVSAAGAVLTIANMKMAGAIRMVSIAKGNDPRDFVLFAFGGAGPLHAAALARELGIPKVVIPARPGITNALGCVVADLRHDFVRTVNQPVAGLDEAAMQAILGAQSADGMALIDAEVVKPQSVQVLHSADMQFVGQTHLLNVLLPSGTVDRATLQSLFEKAYFARFKVELPEIRANLVNLNTSVIGLRAPLDLSTLIDPAGRAADLAAALVETRSVWFDGAWIDTPIYARERLPLDAALQGPAILEQMDATTVLPPGDSLASDTDGNLIITIGGAPA